jgi:hypothetical protein
MCSRVLVILLAFISTQLWAVTISTHRIYLDKSQKTKSMILFNRSIEIQSCRVSLRHYTYGAEGKHTEVKGKDLPKDAANKFLRYSPRSFNIPARAQQNVNIMMRRSINQADGEYRAIFAIACKDKVDEVIAEKSVTITPRLVHNIPIIIRKGKPEVQVALKNITLNNKKVSFQVHRQGERSVYGDVELFNTETNKVESRIRGVSIYPGTDSKSFSFSLNLENTESLILRFREDPTYGGSIEIASAPLSTL